MADLQMALDQHVKLVSKVSAQVREFHDSGTPFRIYHGSTNSTRTVIRNPSTSIDISALRNILFIDTTKRIVSVEPNVPMDALVKATLAHGLIPPVVPEFPGITAGGGFSGSAGESSSFKYGFLDATVEKVEVVLGDGSIREARQDGSEEEKELIHAFAGTLGTMGVLTRLDIRLVEAKDFVELTYHPVYDFEEAKRMIECAISQQSDNEFVDGIMYSSTKGVIITGKMVNDTKGKKISRFSRRTDEWFFLHVEEITSSSSSNSNLKTTTKAEKEDLVISKTSIHSPLVDYVPLTDYLFRYDRGAFWMGKYGCAHFSLPFTKLTRVLLDSLFHTRAMFHALHASRMQQHHIVQDLAVPFKNLVSFLQYLDEDFGMYPLWLCPLKYHPMGLNIKHFPNDTDMLLNIGVWGPWGKKHSSFIEANRALEAKVKKLHGSKWLYAQMTYSKEEFWEIYDKQRYEESREKYSAHNLPDVYDKIKQPEKEQTPPTLYGLLEEKFLDFWILGGLWGLWEAWMGKNYIYRVDRGGNGLTIKT
jgi:Delta24-sterol reductase